MIDKKQFDEMREFFFSGLTEQSYGMIKMKHGDEKHFGDFLSCTFMISKEKTIQRYKFTNHEADTTLKPEQEQQFCSLISVDLKQERKVCRSIFIKLDIPTQKVFITRNLDNGTKEEKII